MATETKQPEIQTLAVPTEQSLSSCRRMGKSEDGSFVQNWRSRFDNFINTPMDEHKQCFKYTVQKMVNMAKIGGEKKPEVKAAENSMPLQSTSAE